MSLTYPLPVEQAADGTGPTARVAVHESGSGVGLICTFAFCFAPARATQLRPQDARMWCAMGQCYEHEQLGMYDAAIRCYRRAVQHDDREGIALHKLVSRRGAGAC